MDETDLRQRKHDKDKVTKTSEEKEPVSVQKPRGSLAKRLCFWFSILFLFKCIILATYLYFIPCPINPRAIQISEKYPEMPPEDRIKLIQSPERLRMIGAECLVVHEASGQVYTGLGNGVIARFGLDLSQPEWLLRTGTAGLDDEYCNLITSKPDPRCGRPLGMRLLNEENLIVIDPFYGIFKINIVKLTKELILDFKNTQVREIKFGNDLLLMPDNNTIFFTDASDEHDLVDFLFAVAELSPRGRLFRYSMDSGELTTVADGLYFCNGVELHRDGKSLLVAETPRARVLRVGAEDGKVRVFADNLIGMPDNLRRSPRGGYWVGLPSMRKSPFLSDFIAAYPIINTVVFKLFSTEFILSVISPKESLFIRLGEEGELLDMYYDAKGEHALHISHAEEFQGSLFVGTFRYPYLLKVPV